MISAFLKMSSSRSSPASPRGFSSISSLICSIRDVALFKTNSCVPIAERAARCEWHSKSAARGQGFGARIVQRAGA